MVPIGKPQAVEAGIVATSRPVPVLLRNSRRFTSFFFERADIRTYPRRRSSSVTGVRIIRRTTGRASAEMPVEKPFSRLRETLAKAANFRKVWVLTQRVGARTTEW